MFTSKGKERALSLTGSIIITIIVSPVQVKDTYFKVKVSDIFTGDWKKFKVYKT
jgi:hypothetical protein